MATPVRQPQPLSIPEGFLIPLHDLYGAERPPMLIEGFLPEKGLVVIAAAPFQGKTNFALHLTGSIVHGTPLLGKFNVIPAPRTRPYRVLWIEQDMQACYWRDQFSRIVRPIRNEEEDVDEAYRNLPGRDEDVYAVFARRPWLGDTQYLERLAEAARENRMQVGTEEWQVRESFDVIIIDTLSAVMGGSNQESDAGNNNSYMTAICKNARYLSERTEACVVILHHLNKSPFVNGRPSNEVTLDRIRGASAIAAEADVIIGLEQLDRSATRTKLTMLKNRAAPEMRDFEFYTTFTRERITYTLNSEKPGTEGCRRTVVSETLKRAGGNWVAVGALIDAVMGTEKKKDTEENRDSYAARVREALRLLEMDGAVEKERGRARWIAKSEELTVTPEPLKSVKKPRVTTPSNHTMLRNHIGTQNGITKAAMEKWAELNFEAGKLHGLLEELLDEGVIRTEVIGPDTFYFPVSR